MESKKYFGILMQYDPQRGFGFVHHYDDSKVLRKFFLHISQVIKGEPQFGAAVYFNVGTPRNPSQRPPAIDAEIGDVLPKFKPLQPLAPIPTDKTEGGSL